MALSSVLALFVAACAGSDPVIAEADLPIETSTTSSSTTLPAYEYPTGFTDDGYAFIGSANAPVSLMEFSDYLCPFCGRHYAQTSADLIERYLDSGDVNFVFRDYPIEQLHPKAPAMHAASLCIAEQSSDLFWAYHDRLFETQSAWGSVADTGPGLEELAEEVGADLAEYQECVESGRTVELVNERVAEGQALGLTATPSFQIVNNQTGETFNIVGSQPLEVFTEALDAVVAGGAPPTTASPEPPPLPYWVSEEGLMPDPDRPGYTMGGDAFNGNPEASLVVIEVSDFQCPFCERHTLETQPAIDEAYVDTGRVMWVFKHLPLAIHPQAQDAAVAAECAGDQQAFWPMHDLLFETVDLWGVDEPEPVLIDLASQLGLDTGAFEGCLDSREALERVLSDLNDVSGVIGSTPTFIVVSGGRAGVIQGAQPFEAFQAAFDQVLESGR